jgi:drug/metabolite transporter (DMT)-like permease
VALVVFSSAALGALVLLARLAYAAGADPVTVLFLRFASASVLMGLLLAGRPSALPRGRTLAGLIAMGAVGYVGQSLTFFTALTLASASLVALLLYLYPALVTVLSVFVLREAITRVQVAALALALVGGGLTVGTTVSGHLLGVVLALASALVYAVYILVGSRVAPRTGAVPGSAVIMGSAALVYGGLAALHGPAFPHTPLGWTAIGAMALVSTVLAIMAFFAGLARVGATTAATLSTVEPVVAVLLATLVLHEPLSWRQVVGGLLILLAVVILSQRAPVPAAGPGETLAPPPLQP